MQSDVEEVFGFKPRRVIVFALGGGGDAASAYANMLWLRERGVESILAAVAWERFVIDPCPGPLRLEEFNSPAVRISPALLEARPGCSVTRGCSGALFSPQVCRLASITGENVYVVNVWRGSLGVAEALEELAGLTGAEAVLAIDVGGDVLAEGYEYTLWSPLADSVALAGILDSGLDGVIGVQSPGADGELDTPEILERLSDAAAVGALRYARLVSRKEAELIEALVARGFVTEAGLAQVMARHGVRGVFMLRGGTRRVGITVLQAMVFYIDAERMEPLVPLARLARRTSSLEEARSRLNDACVFTELDLEEGLWHDMLTGRWRGPRIVRDEGRRWLRMFCV